MATIVLFHHVQGLTPGVQAMAAELRAEGHTVHPVDLFAGKLPKDLEAGILLANMVGEDKIQQRVDKLFKNLPDELVYIGTSWGAALAQQCAQQRPGALEEERSGIGELDAGARAHEQFRTELVLELAHRPAQRRLGDEQQVGRFREAAGLGHADEVAQRPEVHRQALAGRRQGRLRHPPAER